jgi:hypothetical protein
MSAETGLIDPRTEAIFLAEQAKAVVIADDLGYTAAADLLLAIKAMRTKILNFMSPMIEAAHQAHQAALDAKKAADKPLADAETHVKGEMSRYYVAQEKAKREAEEVARKAAEEARKAEEERRRKEMEMLAEAAALENAGKTEAAEKIMMDMAKAVDAVVEKILPDSSPPPPLPKAEGTAIREIWKFRIADPAIIPREYLLIDEIKIGKVVRAMKGETRIAGVEVYAEKEVAASRGTGGWR